MTFLIITKLTCAKLFQERYNDPLFDRHEKKTERQNEQNTGLFPVFCNHTSSHNSKTIGAFDQGVISQCGVEICRQIALLGMINIYLFVELFADTCKKFAQSLYTFIMFKRFEPQSCVHALLCTTLFYGMLLTTHVFLPKDEG